jgi:predicted peptidase
MGERRGAINLAGQQSNNYLKIYFTKETNLLIYLSSAIFVPMKKYLIINICLFAFVLSVQAQFISASFMRKGKTLPYQVMFPEGYDSKRAYPLLLFLHGAGERGNDNQMQLTHGKQFLTDNFFAKYPAIVIAPQCPQDSYWANVERHQVGDGITFDFNTGEDKTDAMQLVTLLLANWLHSGKIDRTRVYVGGLSMGGMGTLELLWRMPNTFAAAFAICGGTNLDKLPVYAANTAVWLFHGDADSVVPVGNSRSITRQLEKLAGEVRYTEYKGVNHNSWDSVFVEKDLPSWIFSHQLPLVKPVE